MNQEAFWTNNKLQKRKSSLALTIRITIFLGVVIFYCIIRPSVFVNSKENYSTTSGGRKLLGINAPQKSDVQENSEEILKLKNFNKGDNKTTIKVSKISNEIEFIPLIKIVNDVITIIHDFSNGNTSGEESTIEDSQILPLEKINCTKPTIYEFPSDGLEREQRRNGWIIIHILLACYCFWLLAVVCDDYFVPAIDSMCSSVKLEADIVGATFMAAAVSSPELFINCIGTFITKTDLGTGTIVGSAVFNILAVPACCGLFTGQIENLDWWPISRDCLMYCYAILCLIITLYDGKVMWYEALVLIISYFTYIIAMLLNGQKANRAKKLANKFQFRGSTLCVYHKEVNEITPLLNDSLPQIDELENSFESNENDISFSNDSESIADNPWTLNERNLIIFILRWPITFLLWITVPDCRKHPKLKYVTFVITVCWLAITSYLVSMFITYVGDTLSIPDSVMGLTILAAGMSIPEAVSSVLVTSQGYGAMGVSNSIGSNTFGILIGLGLPWFVKSYFLPSKVNEYWVILSSSTLTYSAGALLVTLFGFYISFLINKFYLNWKVGISCTFMYIGFLILAIMLELNFFSNVNLPVCEH